MENRPKKKLKMQHVGIASLVGLFPGYYGFTKAVDFFYTRREAMVQIKRIDEMREDREKLLDKLIEVDKKVSKIQGMLEVYLVVKQAQKSRVLNTNEFVKKINEKNNKGG